jgi:hypothetical protein
VYPEIFSRGEKPSNFPGRCVTEIPETVLVISENLGNFLKKPAAQPYYPQFWEVFYAFPVTHTSTFLETFRGTTSQTMSQEIPGFRFSLKRNVMCHFNSVHYVNFEEIWSRFRNSEIPEKRKTVGKKKTARKFPGKIFPGSKSEIPEKFVHFRCFQKPCAAILHW